MCSLKPASFGRATIKEYGVEKNLPKRISTGPTFGTCFVVYLSISPCIVRHHPFLIKLGCFCDHDPLNAS